MEPKREGNYDLLRIICTIAVIAIHVSATYKTAITNEEVFGSIYSTHMVTTLLYNTLSRFAVSCFVMLSGAFMLNNEKNADYVYFYKKTFRNIGIPTLIFSGLYFLYSLAQSAVSIKIGGLGWTILKAPVRALIKGAPFYHMWYLYMMAGVYLLVPIVHRFKNDIGKKSFSRAAWIFLVAACLSEWTSTHTLYWDIGMSFCYLGYFMVGYLIRIWSENHKSNGKGVGFIATGLLVELAAAYRQYGYSMQGIAETEMRRGLILPQSPLIVVSSVLIFCGFSMLNINKQFKRLSENTFLIYLFHAGVWDLLSRTVVCQRIGVQGDNRVIIPAAIAVVFLISYVLAVLYQKIF